VEIGPRRLVKAVFRHRLPGMKGPIDRLRSHIIGFDALNAGFDRLVDGDAVRQVLKASAGEGGRGMAPGRQKEPQMPLQLSKLITTR
jgi:hypothetical protein